MLDSHPEMAVPPESYFIADLGRKAAYYYDKWGAFRSDIFVSDLRKHWAFAQWDVDLDEVAKGCNYRYQTFGQAIEAVFGRYALKQRKGRYADKTPSYVLSIPMIARLIPGSKFIHMVRDGRDVACSWLDVNWGIETLEEAALHWASRVQAGRRAGEWLGVSRYREVKYEQLVSEPEGVLQRLCAFINLDFTSLMLDYPERSAPRIIKSMDRPGLHKNLLLAPTRALRDWRNELSIGDVVRFERLAGDVLIDLEYRVTE